jgi:hypothetical protein
LLRHRTIKKPSKSTIAIATAGIGVAIAASTTAVTWPTGPSVGTATTVAYVSAANGAGSANTARIPEQLQEFKSQVAWQAQLTASAQAQRAAARAAARRAAAERAAAHGATLLAAEQQSSQPQTAPQPTAPPAPPQPSGSPQRIAMSMLGSFGWSSRQFGCLDSLWSRESGWNVTAQNGDGAYGIPQAMPGGKMASAGPDWQTDAATQIRWGLGYIRDLYSSPCGAWAHEEATGWY